MTTTMKFQDIHGNDITVKYVVMTPVQAQKLLDTTVSYNRPITPTNVARLAEDMRDGRFLFTGSTVVRDWRQRLIDGQHRLKACVDSGAKMPVLVVEGVSESAILLLDQNKTRTVGEILKVSQRTVTNQSTVVAAVMVLMQGDKELARHVNNRPRVADMVWELHTEIVPWASWAKSTLASSVSFIVSRQHQLGARKDRRAASNSALCALGVKMERDGAATDNIRLFLDGVVGGARIADETALPYVKATARYLTEVRPMIRTGGTQLPDLFRVFDTVTRQYNAWRGGVRASLPPLSAEGIRYLSDITPAVTT